jgi:hypothetical protein
MLKIIPSSELAVFRFTKNGARVIIRGVPPVQAADVPDVTEGVFSFQIAHCFGQALEGTTTSHHG